MAYFKLCNGNVTESNYKSIEFKAVVNWKKRSGDKTVPTKALDLKHRYHEVKIEVISQYESILPSEDIPATSMTLS